MSILTWQQRANTSSHGISKWWRHIRKRGVGKFLALTIDACIKYLKVSLINRKIINFPRYYRLCLMWKLIFVLDNFMVTPADVKLSVWIFRDTKFANQRVSAHGRQQRRGQGANTFSKWWRHMWKLGVGKFLALTIDACINYLKVSLINRKIINFPRHYRLCLPWKLIFVLDNFMVTPADVKFSVWILRAAGQWEEALCLQTFHGHC